MKASPDWGVTDRDRDFFERELNSFVPDEVFDAHVHLGRRSDWAPLHRELVGNMSKVMSAELYRSQLSWLMPGRRCTGMLAIPAGLTRETAAEGNRFVFEQADDDHTVRHAIVVDPMTSVQQLQDDITRYRPAALKCYHLLTARQPTFEATVGEYLPDHVAGLAHEAELPIIVHLVRSKGLSDEGNQADIRSLSRRYPRMRLVLAHAARGFNPSHTIHGIDAIKGLDNVYFDTSCVTECGAMEAILNAFGPSRLMWGSDYPFSHLHGRCIAIDDGFAWLYDNGVEIGRFSPDPHLQFVLVGLESLRTLKYACRSCRLTDSEVEAIFHHNATALFSPQT